MEKTLDLGTGDGDTVSYEFSLTEAADVYRMLAKSAAFADKRKDPRTSLVIRTQADMIRQKFHIPETPFPDMMGDIEAFHQLFGLEYKGKPRMLPQGLFDFRTKFMDEEKTEYSDEQVKLEDAVARRDDRDVTNSLELQLDALVDLVYVVLGTAYLQFGSEKYNEAWNRVHSANMKKERAIASEDARSKRDTAFDVVKPDGWTAPNHRDLVEDHAHKLFRAGGQLNAGHEHDTTSIPTAQ